jgi:hypothetical protein
MLVKYYKHVERNEHCGYSVRQHVLTLNFLQGTKSDILAPVLTNTVQVQEILGN